MAYLLPILHAGDTVEIIAPASRCTDTQLQQLQQLLQAWGLHCLVSTDIFGTDLLCAHTDEQRFQSLKDALLNPHTKAVVCARGGYGSLRLIPALQTVQPPRAPKLFIGMSDITALQLYLQQRWDWPTLHGALLPDRVSTESTALMKSIMFGEQEAIAFEAQPLNKAATTNQFLESTVIGGNLCLVQTGLGTSWQMDGRNKIIFLEEVGERAYRVDRMLEQLSQANAFHEATAIVFGDLLQGEEPDGSCLIQPVLERFANRCPLPVIQVAGVGHGTTNFPLPLGTRAQLRLGKKAELVCFR